MIFWKTNTKKFDEDEAGIKDLVSLFKGLLSFDGGLLPIPMHFIGPRNHTLEESVGPSKLIKLILPPIYSKRKEAL